MKTLLLGVLLASLVGCDESVRYVGLNIDPRFSPEEQGQIVQAAHAWEAACGRFRFEMAVGSSPDLGRVYRSALVMNVDPAREAVGEVGAINRDQVVVLLASGPDFYSTSLHEFGHVLGLPHLRNDVKGVMNPVVGETEFSSADLDLLNYEWGCQLPR